MSHCLVLQCRSSSFQSLLCIFSLLCGCFLCINNCIAHHCGLQGMWCGMLLGICNHMTCTHCEGQQNTVLQRQTTFRVLQWKNCQALRTSETPPPFYISISPAIAFSRMLRITTATCWNTDCAVSPLCEGGRDSWTAAWSNLAWPEIVSRLVNFCFSKYYEHCS